MKGISDDAVEIIMAILTVAVIAVLVGSSSQTSSVIQSAGSAFSNILKQAMAPVTGGSSGGANALSSLFSGGGSALSSLTSSF